MADTTEVSKYKRGSSRRHEIQIDFTLYTKLKIEQGCSQTFCNLVACTLKHPFYSFSSCQFHLVSIAHEMTHVIDTHGLPQGKHNLLHELEDMYIVQNWEVDWRLDARQCALLCRRFVIIIVVAAVVVVFIATSIVLLVLSGWRAMFVRDQRLLDADMAREV